VPIIEKGLRFDMTVVAHMLGDGQFTVTRPDGKCAGALRPVFASRDLMDESMGGLLRNWLESEGGKTPEQRRLDRDIMEAAELGKDALQAFWAGLSRDQRAMVVGNMDNLKSVAKSADDEAARQKAEHERERLEREAGRADDPFSGQPAAGAPAIQVESLSPQASPEPAVSAPAGRDDGAAPGLREESPATPQAAPGTAAPQPTLAPSPSPATGAERPAAALTAPPPGQTASPAPSKPAAAPAAPAAAQPAASPANGSAMIPVDFWVRPSYEIAPEKKGNRFDWPAWESTIVALAGQSPGLDASTKLREDNQKWIDHFALAQGTRLPGLKAALASGRAAA
jgi:hypothetical protein